MSESCFRNLHRREFIVSGSLAVSLLPTALSRATEGAEAAGTHSPKRDKVPAVVKMVFLYPLPEVCDQGKAEASWQEHHWHPYPGNQYRHAEQQKKFTEKVRAMGQRIGIKIDVAPRVLTTEAEVDRYIAKTSPAAPDAMLIFCMLQQRKPCVSFSINNGNLTASCGCENDITATMTMLLNRYLFGRPGFQHNSEYDEVRNHYFATHCTCATKLNGPDAPAQQYKVRPFFHHLPKTPALDVQWTPETPVILSKMYSERDIRYYTGKVICSPTCPPTGGCATRVLVDFGVDDITSVYMESHPILSVGRPDDARCCGIFSKMFEVKNG